MNTTHQSYLEPFFYEMNVHFNNKWCVLHSYETLPFFSASDVDMAFNGDFKALEKLVLKVAQETEWQICQKIWYNVQSCYYYVLKDRNSNTFLALDFLMDTDGIGRYGFKTSILTENPQIINDFIPIPNNEVAFFYKLVKRIEKKISLDKDKAYLLEHKNKANKHLVTDFYKKHYGEKGKDLLDNYFNSSKTFSKKDLNFLHEKRKKNISFVNKYIRFPFWEFKRIKNRIFKPCGIIIYVPNWSDNQLSLFKELLEKKVDILFRFIKINKENNRKNNFIGFIGSSIMICPTKNLQFVNRIKYYRGEYAIVDKVGDLESNEVEQFVEEYYQVIVNVLLSRMASKKYLIEQ